MSLKDITLFKRNKSFHDKVVKKITIIREQGAPPRTDTLSFNHYVCDLCKGIYERAKIIQCPFCGRWICREKCWNEEHLACLNCTSIIKIVKQSEEMNTESKKNKIEEKRIKGKKEEMYLCEICKNGFLISDLIQCSECGKWVCKENCLDTKENNCLICASK